MFMLAAETGFGSHKIFTKSGRPLHSDRPSQKNGASQTVTGDIEGHESKSISRHNTKIDIKTIRPAMGDCPR